MFERIMRIRFVIYWAASLVAANFVHPTPLFAQEKSLYVLYSGINANYLSLWLAKEARYFADGSLDVQAVHVRGAAPAVQSLLAGQSQIGMVGATVVATAAIQGNKDLVMIGGVTNVMSAVVAARPGVDNPQAINLETSIDAVRN